MENEIEAADDIMDADTGADVEKQFAEMSKSNKVSDKMAALKAKMEKK